MVEELQDVLLAATYRRKSASLTPAPSVPDSEHELESPPHSRQRYDKK